MIWQILLGIVVLCVVAFVACALYLGWILKGWGDDPHW